MTVRALLLSIVAAGCGAQSLPSAFPEAQEPELTRVMDAIAASPPAEVAPVVVAVGGEPEELFAWHLEGRLLWSRPVVARTAPIAAGPFVVLEERDGVVVRSLADGAVIASLGDELRLVGAGGDATNAAIALAEGPDSSPRGVIALASGTSVRWRRTLPLPIGVPAVAGSVVIVPWATQRISFLAVDDGTERLRLRMQDVTVGHAMVNESGAYIGQHGILRLTAALESGRRADAVYYEPRGRPLPGQPPLLRDAYEPYPAPDHAWHRVRLLLRPSGTASSVALADGAIYFQFYRFLFAMDADQDTPRWVLSHPVDLVGAAVVPGGVLAVDRNGNALFAAADSGAVRWTAAMGRPVRAASVRPGAFVPAASGEAPPAPPLSAQLWAAASLEDPRLAGGRELAVRFLARDGSAEVTAQMLSLCSDRRSLGVRNVACDALATRENGREHVLPALQRHASFLADTPAPPVGALARAAGRIGMRGAVHYLLQHLEDPATPTDELPGLFEGLAALRDPSAVPAIEAFLRLYHAESGDPAMRDALVAAATALGALRRSTSSVTLGAVADDPLAEEPVRNAARAAVVALTAPPPAEAPAEPAAPQAPPPPPEPVVDNRPPRITGAMLASLMRGAEPRIVRCLPEEARQARITLRVAPDGAIQAVAVNPAALQSCVEPLVREVELPATRLRTVDQLVHTVRRPPPRTEGGGRPPRDRRPGEGGGNRPRPTPGSGGAVDLEEARTDPFGSP